MYLAQVSVNFVDAVRHLKVFMKPSSLDDESLILKTILCEGFGGAMLRPWAVHSQRGPTTIVVGYTEFSAEELNKRRALALPSVQAAVGEAIAVPLPSFSQGEKYRFSIRLTPTVHVTKSEGRRCGERDAFLVAADKVGKDGGLRRDDVYRDYLAQRLPGATIETGRLAQFRLRKLMRPKADKAMAGKQMPEALMEGSIRVDDPATLLAAIGAGIGRQRAYGCGMLRLQPA
jgi:CRISPR system Cascade subunit CasE